MTIHITFRFDHENHETIRKIYPTCVEMLIHTPKATKREKENKQNKTKFKKNKKLKYIFIN